MEEINLYIEEIRRIKKAQSYLDHIQEVHKNYVLRLDELKTAIHNDLINIDLLNRPSLYALFHRLLGKLGNTLDEKKKHYLELLVEYTELDKSLEKLEFDIEVTERKTKKLEGIKDKLSEAIKYSESKIDSSILTQFRSIKDKVKFNNRLTKELEEAIQEGVVINKKFNATIKYVQRKKMELISKGKKKLPNIDLKKIDKYQDHLISIKHSLIKYEKEIRDVYNIHLTSKGQSNNLVKTYMEESRLNLVSDLKETSGLYNSHKFLKKYKSVIMSTTKSLRLDLRKLKKEQVRLKGQEEELLLGYDF